MLIVTRAFYDCLGYAVIMGGRSHNVAEFGRHLWGSPSLTPCSEQGQEVAQCCVHSCLEYFYRWRFHSISGQPVPLTVTMATVEKMFPSVSFLYFSLCLLPLICSLGTTKKSVSSLSLYAPSGIYNDG